MSPAALVQQNISELNNRGMMDPGPVIKRDIRVAPTLLSLLLLEILKSRSCS